MTFTQIRASLAQEGHWVEAPDPKGGPWRLGQVRQGTPQADQVQLLLANVSLAEVWTVTVPRDEILVTTLSHEPQDFPPPRVNVPGWDEYFMDVAEVISARAKCRRRQVGAVIVSPGNRIVATGYNGHPQSGSSTDCLSGGCPRGLLSAEAVAPYSSYDAGPGICIASHAETNALGHRSEDCRGARCYVTAKPCFGCTKMLLSHGVVSVMWPDSPMTKVNDLFAEYVHNAVKEGR